MILPARLKLPVNAEQKQKFKNMNYLKIQFNNGNIHVYKTCYDNPDKDTLKSLNSGLFREYKHLNKKISDCNNLELFYGGLNNEKTVNFLGAKVLVFERVDGRKKEIRKLNYYSHRFLFENY